MEKEDLMGWMYWYVDLDSKDIVFGETKTDIVNFDAFTLSTAQAMKKITAEAELLGRRVLKIKRVRIY
jgi:hypothetical protein